MTVYCYEGLPGSGKSYDAVRKMINQLKMGRRIVTNIDGVQGRNQQECIKHYIDRGDRFLYQKLIYLDSEQVEHFWDYTQPGDLIIIDEAQNFFNSRDWQNDQNRQFGKWASEHRKRGVDLVFITQDMNGVESSVRRLVEWNFRYKKLNMFGRFGAKKYVRFCYFGQSTEAQKQKICNYDPQYFKFYQSYFTDEAKELGVEKPPNVFKHPIFFIIPGVLLILGYFISQSSFVSGDLFGSQKMLDSVSEKLSPGEAAAGDLSEAVPGPVVSPETSKQPEYKVLGVINGKTIIRKDGAIVPL